MKNLLLKNIKIVSHKERKAKKVDFDPLFTVIKGKNDTGKSSLIKSIYYAFGATPHDMHPDWLNSAPAILVEFSLDDDVYKILRYRDVFSLFTDSNELIGVYNSVTKELAPALSKLFGYKLQLINNQGDSTLVPPAYIFLPFYLDQDEGWVKILNSFKSLKQYSRWTLTLVEYHLGIKSDYWYELNSIIKDLKKDLREPTEELQVLNRIEHKTLSKMSRLDFDIDVESFKNEIDLLLNKVNDLKSQEDNYRKKIVELNTEKIRLEAQIEIVARTHNELSSDYKYSVNLEDNIGCPTCGAEYSNSFSERFSLANDANTCNDLLMSLNLDLKNNNNSILSCKNSINSTMSEVEKLNSILHSMKGKIRLSDLLKSESRKTLLEQIRIDSKLLSEKINDIDSSIEKFNKELKQLDDRKKRKEIKESYREVFKQFSIQLNALALQDKVFKNLSPVIQESGSDKPRALLAYFFTILTLINEHGKSLFAPIIIDSPNQQEQDQENLELILKFIRDKKPKGKQLILGLVDSLDIDFKGGLVMLDQKNSLLESKLYDELSMEITPFIESTFANSQS